jgi:hypothetical protein
VSVVFPSADFFRSLRTAMNDDRECARHLSPSEAYCGLAVDDHLYVLEFDGHLCSALVAGGNELDLDFVVAGPTAVWRQAIDTLASGDARTSLPSLVEKGALEIRSADASGQEMAAETLPLLQVFIEQARGLDVEFASGDAG